jgi:hypothetical protein
MPTRFPVCSPPVLLAFTFLLPVKECDTQGRAMLWLVLLQGLGQPPEPLRDVGRACRPLQPGDHLLGMAIPWEPVRFACCQHPLIREFLWPGSWRAALLDAPFPPGGALESLHVAFQAGDLLL